MNKNFYMTSVCVAGIMLMASEAPVKAQNRTETQGTGEADASVELPEIVVTGRGRNEILQDSPAAITAFSTQALQDARIQGVADFIALTPGMSIVQSQSTGISFITIRGVGQVRNGESPVAVVRDGVQQITSRQFTSDLFDVQQIEVLRGPQGALYGRNAIGGAVVITTQQPTNDFQIHAKGSVGNGDDWRAQVAVSGPIIADKLLARVSGSYRDFGGLFRNAFLNKSADRLRDSNIRGQLRALPTETMTVDLRGSYSHSKVDGYLFQFQGANYDPLNPCALDPANPFGGPLPDADRFSGKICTNNLGRNDRTLLDGSLTIRNSWDWGTISNTAAFVHVKEYLASDQFPFTASRNVFGTDGTQTQYETLKAFQNEFRITSNDDGAFKWMVGAYYLKIKRFISTTTGVDNGLGIIDIYREPQFSSAINPTVTFLADNNRNETYALFANVGYSITPQLDVSLAYRYDHDSRKQDISPLSNLGVPAGCTVAGSPACRRVAKFHKGQPKITINYRPTDSVTLFADYGIGFRSGQFNQAGSATAANLPGVFDLVKAESAETAEAGIKTRLLDSKLTLNLTGYYTKDKNPFYFLFVPAAGAQVLVNIDKTELYGGELEANLRIMPGLEIFGNYSFTKSKIKQFVFTPANVGNRQPYVPEDGGVLGAQYRTPLTGKIDLFVRGDVEHHGKQYWDPENSTARSSFQLVNLRGGLEVDNGRWSVVGYVNNVANKRYNAEFISGGFVYPAPPRTYGIDLEYRF